MNHKLAKRIEKLDAYLNLQAIEFEKNYLTITENYEEFVINLILKGILEKLQSELNNHTYDTAEQIVTDYLQESILSANISSSSAFDLVNYQCTKSAFNRYKDFLQERNE